MKEVRAPDGRVWRVRRRVQWPRRREFGSFDLADPVVWAGGPMDDGLSFVAGLVLSLVALVVVGVLLVLFLPLLVFLAEAVVVAVGAFALARPWIVEAESGDELRRWRVRGFLGSRAAVAEVARELHAGVTAAPERAVP